MAPKNGSMIGGLTTFPNEVTFSCDEGFIMRGTEKRKCQVDGTWSGNVTSCVGMSTAQYFVSYTDYYFAAGLFISFCFI